MAIKKDTPWPKVRDGDLLGYDEQRIAMGGMYFSVDLMLMQILIFIPYTFTYSKMRLCFTIVHVGNGRTCC